MNATNHLFLGLGACYAQAVNVLVWAKTEDGWLMIEAWEFLAVNFATQSLFSGESREKQCPRQTKKVQGQPVNQDKTV